jgi:hypothetical protein
MGETPPGALRIIGILLFGQRRSIIRTIAQLIVLVAIGLGVLTAIDAVRYPWAFSWIGGRALTGDWHGEFAAPGVGPHAVYMELRADFGGRSARAASRIAGKALMCDGAGLTREFAVRGRTLNWRGTALQLETGRRDDREGRVVQLQKVEGEWDGDTIRANGALSLYELKDGAARWSSAEASADGDPGDPVVPLTLQRGNEADFRRACQRLKQSAGVSPRS